MPAKYIWNTATIVFLVVAVVAAAVAMALQSREAYAHPNPAGSSQEISCERRALWTHETDGPILAVIDGVAYGYMQEEGKHYFYAMDPYQGERLWRYQTGDRVDIPPAVAGGVVYFGSNDNFVYALDAATGQSLAWRYRTGDDLIGGIEEAGGVVYARSKDRFLYALDADTGSLLWSFDTEQVEGPQAKSADGVVYIGSIHALQALDATTGDLLWAFRQHGVGFYDLAVFGEFVYPSGFVLDKTTGEHVGQSGYIGVEAVSDGVVYANHGNLVVAFDETTRNLLWAYTTHGDGTGLVVYGDTVYVGTYNGWVQALDKHTSALLWECPMGGARWHGFQNFGAVVFIWSYDQLSVIGVPELPGELPAKSTPTPAPTTAQPGTSSASVTGNSTTGQPSPPAAAPSGPLPTPTPRPMSSIGEPTINFHASSTEVETNAPITLTLSVANSITQPDMTLQLVLQLPSGVVISGEGLGACTVQCSVTYQIPTGENRDFLLEAVASSPGPYEVAGQVVWFFGEEPEFFARKQVTLPFMVVDPLDLSVPTVNLHATQTEVNIGEPVILTLAADNSIAKPEMTLKFILRPPSGWSIKGSGFTEACSGQCTATYQVPSGDQRSINIEMMPNQAGGPFEAEAVMEWYFGGDRSTLTRHTKSLSLRVLEAPEPEPTAAPIVQEPVPGSGSNGGSCGLSPAGATTAGPGDMALLALPLLGMAGALGWRRYTS